eukprot:TRINITY_DN4630_c0_g1_i1.p1 TRINITY_DN4630_c0_g1~~TRINITY_DN4630_c0_g1_i1.p1  ORF type:complete len:265 (-),score=32.80 TRINITY_DN4630_c0_g1_i1:83-877(-)
MKVAQAVVYAFLAFHLALLVPDLWNSYFLAGVTLSSWLFFQASSRLLTKRFFEAPSYVESKKNQELDNRVISMLFNFGTGIPPYLAYYDYLPGLVLAEVIAGDRTTLMDFFAGWTIGYILYDFPLLVHLFPDDPVIQLHHVAELLIVKCYTSTKFGGAYLFGGGLMQLSSGILHIQRIIMVTSSVSNAAVLTALHWLLTASWIHSRLWVFPTIMYKNYEAHPFTPLHAFCFLAGSILVLMSLLWLRKIVMKGNLNFKAKQTEGS